MKYFLLAVGCIIHVALLHAQAGCTDPKAQNYNAAATVNNGSCTYPATTVTLTHVLPLYSPTLDESSGLVYTDGALWTHNDSGNPPAIYRIDPTNGTVLQTVNITNATNEDWEDITADAQYIYIGDFGNNVDGVRTDLRVYRISKSDITSASTINVTAAIIHFSYSDQVIGTSPGVNATEFDCEAFFVKDNMLQLFTKDWVNGHTKHYQLSTVPGTYVISSSEPYMDVDGLVTSADISADNQVVLVGYSNGGLDVFMYLLYGYSGNNFFSGNKRRLDLGSIIDLGNMSSSRGQVEAVTFTDNGNGYISSERFHHTPFDVPARLSSFSVGNLLALPVHLLSFTASYQDPVVGLNWQTASETNSSFFAVERSTDAIRFTEIGRRPAAGRSAQVRNYQYTDPRPVTGNNYYRLRQMDTDGNSKIYSIKTVKVPEKKETLHVYMQSSANTVVIETNNIDQAHVTYRLFNVGGSLLKKGGIYSPAQTVDIGLLAKGTYFITLSDGEKTKFQKK